MNDCRDREVFTSDWESIRGHEAPEWFHDAKLGIFIHWGLFSVPAWATPIGELGTIDWTRWFANNPYAEWYLNTLRIEGSPTQTHHRATYGNQFDYFGFARQFNDGIKVWDPAAMASLFAAAQARYVVLTTKHHDGFTLWPSRVEHPLIPNESLSSSRDIVGELTTAVRAAGMRMGLYYSGGLDWTFNPTPITDHEEVRATINHTRQFAEYADAHWRELIRNYDPIILWNDIGYPEQGGLAKIVADFYNAHPDGVINDRFEICKPGAPARHSDFVTPEYTQMDDITESKWETCRGLGYSFGYNRIETTDHTVGEAELIHLLIDIVSKNGNLLLNVGPMADGSIPQIQADRLRALGAWLKVNGEAIFGTRPWSRATGATTDGIPVRFTTNSGVVYAILLGQPKTNRIGLDLGLAGTKTEVGLIGDTNAPTATYENRRLAVTFAAPLPNSHAHVLRIQIY